ncbi:hypothetical protein ACFCXB_09040, partial [Streptomyces noursei]
MARVTAAAVTVSALAASLAGCMSVSDPGQPTPSGSTARHGDEKGRPHRPGGLTVDGRGGGPHRAGHGGPARPADGGAGPAGEGDAGASSSPEPSAPQSAPVAPPQPAHPSGP